MNTALNCIHKQAVFFIKRKEELNPYSYRECCFTICRQTKRQKEKYSSKVKDK